MSENIQHANHSTSNPRGNQVGGNNSDGPEVLYHDHSQAEDDALLRMLLLDSQRTNQEKTFPLILYEILNKAKTLGFDNIISWQPHGRSFKVHDHDQFVERVIPVYFDQTKFSSFQRRLNLYGFRKITKGRDKGGFYHELFLRSKEFLCHRIKCQKKTGSQLRKCTSRHSPEPDFYKMSSLPEDTQNGQLHAASHGAPRANNSASNVNHGTLDNNIRNVCMTHTIQRSNNAITTARHTQNSSNTTIPSINIASCNTNQGAPVNFNENQLNSIIFSHSDALRNINSNTGRNDDSRGTKNDLMTSSHINSNNNTVPLINIASGNGNQQAIVRYDSNQMNDLISSFCRVRDNTRDNTNPNTGMTHQVQESYNATRTETLIPSCSNSTFPLLNLALGNGNQPMSIREDEHNMNNLVRSNNNHAPSAIILVLPTNHNTNINLPPRADTTDNSATIPVSAVAQENIIAQVARQLCESLTSNHVIRN